MKRTKDKIRAAQCPTCGEYMKKYLNTKLWGCVNEKCKDCVGELKKIK